MKVYLCRCRSLWCWLDQLTFCRSRRICDAHDRHITREDYWSADSRRRLTWSSQTGTTGAKVWTSMDDAPKTWASRATFTFTDGSDWS